jgi:hypothetical protein
MVEIIVVEGRASLSLKFYYSLFHGFIGIPDLMRILQKKNHLNRIVSFLCATAFYAYFNSRI